jgi:hypothetical protein
MLGVSYIGVYSALPFFASHLRRELMPRPLTENSVALVFDYMSEINARSAESPRLDPQ